MLWLLRGQGAHGGRQRTQGGAGDTPPGGAAAVAVLWGDLPLLTGIRPAASLLSFQPLPCGNHFYAKYFLSLSYPNLPAGQGGGQDAGSIIRAEGTSLHLLVGRGPSLPALRTHGGRGPGSPRFSACPPHWPTPPARPASTPLGKHDGDSPQSHSALTFDKRSLAFPCSNMLSVNI